MGSPWGTGSGPPALGAAPPCRLPRPLSQVTVKRLQSLHLGERRAEAPEGQAPHPESNMCGHRRVTAVLAQGELTPKTAQVLLLAEKKKL